MVEIIKQVVYAVDKYLHTPSAYKELEEYKDNWTYINEKILEKVMNEGLTTVNRIAVLYLETLKEYSNSEDILYYGGTHKINLLVEKYKSFVWNHINNIARATPPAFNTFEGVNSLS